MEPQVKKIFSKLSKFELATEKVELNVVDDLNKVLNSSQDLEKEIKKLNELIGTNRKYMIEAFREGNKLKKVQEKATDRRNKAEREFINAKDELNKVNIDYNSAIKREKQFDEDADRLVKKRKPLITQAFKNISFFDKTIAKAEKAAKELGMKIPTASFSKMRDRLDKLTRIL